ncbi:hypothetical protein Y1Q_0002183 [Alligator mississippiensis]|uniref:Cilia- and flagella-associated protein 299 n=1 Tax=Alligator mississippiensis TaxID=8496 RepID=A0A151MQ09_ALLMI|nr:hypothetical protein Y1Q_0002183 [Alligator mississippiensis]
MEGDDAAAALDHVVTAFGTYEEYLDSQVTTQDLYYLENEEMARQLVELGFRGSGEVLKREEFEARKAAAEASRLSERTQQNTNTAGSCMAPAPFPIGWKLRLHYSQGVEG